ncbi:MAG: RHS repeat-associated core domain-containing protein [Planctomycetota bacterium]
MDWTDANLDGTFAAGERTGSVEYLIENANFTGYQQTILEVTKNAAGQATKRISYTFGVDEITQTVSQIDPSSQLITQSSTLTFAHDGKGSVRALFGAAAAIAQVFTYSAYGELLAIYNGSGTLQPLTSSLTSVLYNGEGFDARTGLYNMRARWYSASNARWERLDPFAGNPTDPFSFNKYGFVHGDPVQGIDPSWMFFGAALGALGSLNAVGIGMQMHLETLTRGGVIATALGTIGRAGMDLRNYGLEEISSGDADSMERGWKFFNMGSRIFQMTSETVESLDFVLDASGSAVSVISIIKGLGKAIKNGPEFLANVIEHWCFDPSTLVATELGKKAIGEVLPGERVFCYDEETGDWTTAIVQARHDNTYTGEWVHIGLDNEIIEVTAGHRFFVLDLGDSFINETRDPDGNCATIRGQWVESQRLACGDRILCKGGLISVVQSVDSTFVTNRRVCNLTVDSHHNFVVGQSELLAHNEGWCALYARKSGRSMPQALISLIEGGIETAKGIRLGFGAIHGHHIVMKGKWKNIPSVKKAQDILATFDIDLVKTQAKLRSLPKDELHNMSYAINSYKGIHSQEYADAVLAKLEAAVADGRSYQQKRDKVIAALDWMRNELEYGRSFW